jgi:hypothetical protein
MKQLFQLNLSDDRESNMPPKMNILAEDRAILIQKLQCCWKIDYIMHN